MCESIFEDVPIESDADDKKIAKDNNIVELIKQSLLRFKQEIEEKVCFYQYGDCDNRGDNYNIIQKYMWRIIPFNYTCDYLVMYPKEIDYLKHTKGFSDDDKKEILDMKINYDDFIIERVLALEPFKRDST